MAAVKEQNIVGREKNQVEEGQSSLERKIPMKCPKPKIQKVHFLLRRRENLEKFFEPKVVTFGPIHHDRKPEYAIAEAFKESWKNKFLKKTGQREEDLLRRIEEDIQQLRSYYEDGLLNKTDDRALARMLFVDGCAVLHYIDCYGRYEELNIKPNIFVCVVHDMFLLENQLPFRVINLLISESRQGKKKWKETIKGFICGIPIAIKPRPQEIRSLSIDADEEDQNPTHLLELLRESLLRPTIDDSKGKGIARGAALFRSAVELKESGIIFKRKKSRYFNNITFKQHLVYGTLEIPTVMVDDTTGPIFRNLIAVEMCPDFPNSSEVTAYICFLDTLVDSPRDVKELRKAHIVRNFLGSDEELACLFNEIATDLVTDSQFYIRLMAQIQSHCDTECRTTLAKFFSTHFTYPWRTIAFFAALILFAINLTTLVCCKKEREPI